MSYSAQFGYRPDSKLARQCSDYTNSKYAPYSSFFTAITKRLKMLKWYDIYDAVLSQDRYAFNTEVLCIELALKKHYESPTLPMYLFRPLKQSIGVGLPVKSGFMLLAGARASLRSEQSLRRTIREFRERAFSDPFYGVNNDQYFFVTTNILFENPTRAASFLLGTPVSGPQIWRTKKGTTLKEVLRNIEAKV